MIINILENVTGKHKTGLMKRQVVELYRVNVYSEHQILEAVGISRTLLRRWNRYYDRYRNKKRVYIKMYGSMKTKTTNEIAALRRKVAELEQYSSKLLLEKQALETVITLAEDHRAACAVQVSHTKKVWPRWRTTPGSDPFKHTKPFGWYAATLRTVWEKPSGLV